MRIELDEARDVAKFYFSDERQSYEAGATYLVVANHEDNPKPLSVEVQLGFEADQQLLWMSVHPATTALPPELLDSAKRV